MDTSGGLERASAYAWGKIKEKGVNNNVQITWTFI